MGRRKTKDDTLNGKRETSGSMMITRKWKLDQEFKVVNNVFSNPLLMDKILQYAVHKPNGKGTDRKTGVAIRLINKNWLQSASRTLKKLDDPMIKVTVGEYNSMNLYHTKNDALLEKFLLVFSKNSKRSSDSILPLSFTTDHLLFVKTKSELLRNFLEQCGDMIREWNVTYPCCDDVGLMTSNWDGINCPNLQALQFYLFDPVYNYKSKSKSRGFGSMPNGLTLLQKILQNSENLKHFEFDLDNNLSQAIDISSLSVPATVESMILNGTLTRFLTMVQNNKLPNLKTLTLKIYAQDEAVVMFKILEHFSKQLVTFTLSVLGIEEDSSICVRVPLMEKLNCLTIFGDGFYLSPELKHVWPTLVPNLTCLELDNLVQPGFVDLVRSSRFENVKKLKLTPEELGHATDLTFSPDVQAFREIEASFPNIQKLTLLYEIDDMSSLKYLFQNFTHLKNLQIFVNAGWYCGSLLEYEMVSLFLGIPSELAETIVNGPRKHVSIPVENPVSIMNLKELSSFTLSIRRDYHVESFNDPFCLKVISRHGLEKMPSLQKIKLSEEVNVYDQEHQYTVYKPII